AFWFSASSLPHEVFRCQRHFSFPVSRQVLAARFSNLRTRLRKTMTSDPFFDQPGPHERIGDSETATCWLAYTRPIRFVSRNESDLWEAPIDAVNDGAYNNLKLHRISFSAEIPSSFPLHVG